jgi:tight adherence protein B
VSRTALGLVWGLAFGLGLLSIVSALLSPPRQADRRKGALARLVTASGIEHVTPASVVAACLGSALVVAFLALALTAVPVVAFLAGAFAGNIPILMLRRRARARSAAVSRSWPEAVDMLASAIRAGMSLPEAVIGLASGGPAALRPSCSAFAMEYRASGSFTGALSTLQDSVADPVADRVVAALRIAREVGGSDLGVVLRTLSTLLREDARTRGEIEGRQSWTVSAARMSVAAPWITLALLRTRPEAVRAYSSPAGAVVLAAAAGLSVVANRLMLRIGRLPTERRIAA